MTENAEDLFNKADFRYIHDVKKRRECIGHLKRALELAPDVPKYWFRLGYFYRYDRDFALAEAAYSLCIDLTVGDPWPWAYFYRGRARFAQEKYEEAIQDFDRVEDIELGEGGDEFFGPGALSEVYLWRADAHEVLGNYTAALSDFKMFGCYGKRYVTEREVKRLKSKMEAEKNQD